MNLDELQKWVSDDWQHSSKKQPDQCLQLMYLFEELGELVEAIRKSQGDKERKRMAVDIDGEMGDVVIALATIANHHKISLSQAVAKSKQKIINRHKQGL